MDILIRFGFSIEEIKNMMDTNIDISNVFDDDLIELIDILKRNGCEESTVKNILLANPFYLNRNVEDVNKLLEEMSDFGLGYLNVIFDSNPFMLNYEASEFANLIDTKRSEGLNDEEIKDFISYELV